MIWNQTKDYAGAMTQHSHQTAPTQFVNTAGVRFAYRRFGKSTGMPLVFNMHFTGTMDHWDPLWAAYCEPQAVLKKLGIKLAVAE